MSACLVLVSVDGVPGLWLCAIAMCAQPAQQIRQRFNSTGFMAEQIHMMSHLKKCGVNGYGVTATKA